MLAKTTLCFVKGFIETIDLFYISLVSIFSHTMFFFRKIWVIETIDPFSEYLRVLKWCTSDKIQNYLTRGEPLKGEFPVSKFLTVHELDNKLRPYSWILHFSKNKYVRREFDLSLFFPPEFEVKSALCLFLVQSQEVHSFWVITHNVHFLGEKRKQRIYGVLLCSSTYVTIWRFSQ